MWFSRVRLGFWSARRLIVFLLPTVIFWFMYYFSKQFRWKYQNNYTSEKIYIKLFYFIKKYQTSNNRSKKSICFWWLISNSTRFHLKWQWILIKTDSSEASTSHSFSAVTSEAKALTLFFHLWPNVGFMFYTYSTLQTWPHTNWPLIQGASVFSPQAHPSL